MARIVETGSPEHMAEVEVDYPDPDPAEVEEAGLGVFAEQDAPTPASANNNVGRHCEVIGHWLKGRVWKVIDERDGLLILSASLGPGRMCLTFIAYPDQVASLY